MGVGYTWVLVFWLSTFNGAGSPQLIPADFPSYQYCMNAGEIARKELTHNYENKTLDMNTYVPDPIIFGYYISYTCIPKNFNGTWTDFDPYRNQY